MMKGDPDSIPTWFVKGRTALIPKKGCQRRPKQYQPITCLNTEYKLLTAVMTEVLYDHAIAYSLLPTEQQAIHRGHHGCLHALMIDSMVAKEATVCCRDLSVAWIDYQKAYNKVLHEWIPSYHHTTTPLATFEMHNSTRYTSTLLASCHHHTATSTC